MDRERARRIVRTLVAIAMTAIGVLHFVDPVPFVRIVPEVLPAKLALVYVSGAFEIAFGLGLLIASTRRMAALGLVALLVAVFPANVNMAIHQIQLDPGSPIPVWAMWARLPFQIVFVLLALFAGEVWPRPPARARR